MRKKVNYRGFLIQQPKDSNHYIIEGSHANFLISVEVAKRVIDTYLKKMNR